ncbi:MAG: DEAD/DEAH box helicase, partial [Nitrospirales bacterium]
MSTTLTSTFASLGLSAGMLRDIAKAGFLEPTPIQAQAIPAALEGRDVLGCAQTGTGKTAAFLIPMIERLADAAKGLPRGLVLVPTRELALQIQATVDQLGRSRQVFATTIMGGADMQAQIRALRQQPDILVATPGRLLDHMWNGTIHMTSLQIVVLDEADRMLDMGFAPQINQILDALPEQRQTLLFSATVPTDLADLARVSVKDPVRAMVA